MTRDVEWVFMNTFNQKKIVSIIWNVSCVSILKGGWQYNCQSTVSKIPLLKYSILFFKILWKKQLNQNKMKIDTSHSGCKLSKRTGTSKWKVSPSWSCVKGSDSMQWLWHSRFSCVTFYCIFKCSSPASQITCDQLYFLLFDFAVEDCNLTQQLLFNEYYGC